MAVLAAIDMGTNTFRLLVAEMRDGASMKPLYSENRIVRLGEGFGEKKEILPAAAERAVAALSHFQGTLQKYRIDDLAVVGTSAIREAANRADFLREVKRRTGFDVQVLSGEEEALYVFLGVNLVMKNETDAMLVIDIGGGSAEFIGAEGDTPTFLLSAELGVVHLTEKYLHSDPPAAGELKALRSA
ncbi:MAG TPA: hypothetical protein VIK48_02660, partial [Candidatus Manganitrophaceae bacterium]